MAPILAILPPLSSPLGIGAVLFGVLCLLYLAERWLVGQPLPRDVPLLREPAGARRFSLRTRLAYYTNCQQLFQEAYENYSKRGKAVIIPGVGFRSEVILPNSSMKWVMAQPESTLSVAKAFVEMDKAGWSLGDAAIGDPWQGQLVRTEMNRVLENTASAVKEELSVVFDENFGLDTENWNEIDIVPTINKMIAQVGSRFTVGLPLCRNPEYVQLVADINNLLVMNAGIVGALPRVLQPVLGRPVNLYVRAKLSRMKELVIPQWKERLQMLKRNHSDTAQEEPLDHMQMMVRWAAQHRPQELQNYDLILGRLAAANFGAAHQTGIQAANLLLNVIGSDSSFNTMAVLRDESARVVGAPDTTWTKALVSQLVKADSVCRETLRLGAFGGRAVFRKVMVDGLTTDQHINLPRGTLFTFFSQPVHTDPEKHEDPLRFDPFRFSRIREGGGAQANSFVTTSPEFLPFGHGKHACPGRFLIDFELKMILDYALRHYDLKFPDEYEGKRPPNRWLAEAVLPPSGVKIQVRRRHDS